MKYRDLITAALDQPLSGFEKRDVKSGTDNKAMIYAKGTKLVVAFMYTYGTIHDWLNNFKVWRRKVPTLNTVGSAHAGFVYEYNAIRAALLAAVKDLSPTEITLTGFSQGAGHAILATMDFVTRFPGAKISTTIFACPMVYDDRGAMNLDWFVGQCQVKVERITAFRDLVTRSPGWVFGYRHCGEEKVVDGKRWWIFSSMKHHNPDYYTRLAEALDLIAENKN